ncbi:response regulator transcription factor [Marispirochaeta aestuarii]|uniref:response regulator transcription factor n=1 Tax=Marispirochaeta aestuarii TaxID=1963862 RepID=UPI0029C9002C|nr:response regulator transcription factor [Marispirochaeta aestuarii]
MYGFCLIVEDEDSTALRIKDALSQSGLDFAVSRVSEGSRALEILQTRPPKLVLLDLILPDMDGYQVGRKCMEEGIPFLIISSRTLPMEVALGLNIGAEDYVGKPFDTLELAARIRRVFRRIEPSAERDLPRVRIDSSRRSVFVEGREVDLTPKELKILGLLADRRGAYVSSEELARRLDYREAGSEALQAVRVNIRRLRAKLEPDPSRPRYILNRWGAGYALAGSRQS